MTMMRTHGALFDCDGTLLDSMAQWRSLQDATVASLGLALSPEDEDLLTRCTIPEMAGYVQERFSLDITTQDLCDWAHGHMLDFYRNRVLARDGAVEYVRMVHDSGAPVAIVSSSPRDCLEAGLGHCGILPYVDDIFSAEELQMSKRSPQIFRLAAKRMGIRARDAWVFDDALYAVSTAKGAGFKVVGIFDDPVAGTFEQLSLAADLAIRGFAELQLAFPPCLKG